MPETPHAQQDIAYIRTHVEQLEQMVAFEMRANPAAREQAIEAFKRRPRTAELYLALEDGPATQKDLIARLSMDKSKVSKICNELQDVGFVAEVATPDKPGQRSFAWTAFERYLGLSKLARNVDRDEKAAKKKVVAATVGQAKGEDPAAPPSSEAGKDGDS